MTAEEERQREKELGNVAFKQQDYEAAIGHYTTAAETAEAGELAVLLANRAMARMRIAGGMGMNSGRREALEVALEDARQGVAADSSYAKAHFRVAQCHMQLGRTSEAVRSLQSTFLLSPADSEVHKLLKGTDWEVHKLLMRHDSKYQRFIVSLERISESTDKKRADLKAMVSHGHPMTLRVAYYKTWMTRWTPKDREVALSQAFLEVVDKLKEDMKEHAKAQAIEQKERGEVTFGEDGFGVANRMNELNGVISNEGFGLASTCLEELVSETSYNEPSLYCACVEAVSEGREDEPKWLPPDRRARLTGMRPTILFGTQAADATHPLREWMCVQMAMQLRKQVLIAVCIKVCMASAGVVQVQATAMFELRNMRRAARGLEPLKPGEEEEDDEILNKTDFEEYQDRTMVDAQTAMDVVRHPTFQVGAKYLRGPDGKLLEDKSAGQACGAEGAEAGAEAEAQCGEPAMATGKIEPGQLI